MKLVVLSILRVDEQQKEHKVAMYAGLSSNKYIYGKLMSNCQWPTYIRIKRGLTKPSCDEKGNGTLVRKLFVEDVVPMEFSKKFMELTRCNPNDISYIDNVDKVISAVQYIIENGF